MESKLQELTNKLYAEGVKKANDEAEVILDKAKSDAELIIADAKKEAEKLIQQANTESAELKRNMESELKLASQQAIATLQQKIVSSLTLQVVDPSVKEGFSNVEFVKNLIAKIVEQWSKSGDLDMNLLLSETDQKELETYFKNSLADKLNKGLSYEFDSNVKSGFKIGPKDGSYLISFTAADFQNFFKGFLRPKTTQLLFEE